MHADSLYHRMLDQEKAVEEAKAEGRPVPTFRPILSTKSKVAKPSAETALKPALEESHAQASDLTSKVQEAFKKRLEGLDDNQRILEERAIKAEIQAGEQVAEHLTTIFEKQEAERRKRKEEGRETIADKMTSLFKWQ